MKFEEYEIVTITPEQVDIFSIRVKPQGKKHIPVFKAGQFYHLRNTTYHKPQETRQFSIITTPKTKKYMEFCIKTYGPWTQALREKKSGESIWLFGPMGAFTVQQEASHAVFIAGGVGITPIISMIQSLHEKNSSTPLTLIYANKSPQHILKKKHIEDLFRANPIWKLVFLVSQDKEYITEKFLQQEVDITVPSVFYVCGSQRFTQNIIAILKDLQIPDEYIKQEVFLPPYPKK